LELTIAGVHAATDDLLGECAVINLTSLGSPDPWPNALFVWTSSARVADSLASSLEATYGGPSRPILHTMDAAAVLTASRPQTMSSLVLAQTYMPGAGVMTMVFAFCGIGLFTTVTLGFSDRRRDIAIFKTIGLESGGVVAMLLTEQALVAASGAALGMALAAIAIPRLAGFFPGDPSLSGLNALKGVVAGAAVLAAAAFLPAATARVATVNQLLYNLPVPLRAQRVSGQTGV
jgi:ABC-type antimicrobial peptide transport system permease subunit